MSAIKVTVNPTGDTKVEAIGIMGGACKTLTRPIENAIGGTTASQDKPELHQLGGADQTGGIQATL